MINKYTKNISGTGNSKVLYKSIYIVLCMLTAPGTLPVTAQITFPGLLQEQFKLYSQRALPEKIYLHNDKDIYLAGEICWFKIYNVDGIFHKPLGLSKVVYVEVLDKNNNAVLKAMVSMKEGSGNGSMFLPYSLSSGNYILRAYTNWMKNFSPDYYYEKKLTIINSRKINEGTALVQKERYDIQFFPEGGNLVNGIQSKIAFRMLGQNGKGIPCEGEIINDKNEPIVKYASLKFGMGSFLLTPEANHSYRAVSILPDGKTMIQALPAAYNDGYVMRLEPGDKNQLKITVHAAPGNSVSSAIYLFAHTRGSIKSASSEYIKNGYAEFLIDKNKLGDGISHFTVFNANRQPVCERLYFKYPEKRLEIAMSTDSLVYGLRKKITIHINATDQDGKAEQANLSMAVYKIDSLQELQDMDISSYLWLRSDLTGIIESPGYYFINKGTGAEEAMDNLMLTQGWRRFKWEDIQQQKNPVFEFIPEYAGHLVSAKITHTGSGLPGKEIGAYLSVAGIRTQFKPAKSDANGQVLFDMKDFYNQGEIIVQTNNQQDSGYSMEVSNPFAETFSKNPIPDFYLPQINAGALQSHHMGMEVQNGYYSNNLKIFLVPALDTNAFYFKADLSYLLDNYVRFTTLEEVLREYVAQVFVKRKEGKFHLAVWDEIRKEQFDMDPLVLLDAVPVFDVDKFMQYDPLKIRKIEVISRMYYMGSMFFAGIVNAVTYNGNLEGYELDPHATVMDYEGLQRQREFFSPLYETNDQVESRMPDYRSLLYWAPDIITNEKGKQDINFFSSDLPGMYAMVLQGLTVDGKTGSTVQLIEIMEHARVSNK